MANSEDAMTFMAIVRKANTGPNSGNTLEITIPKAVRDALSLRPKDVLTLAVKGVPGHIGVEGAEKEVISDGFTE